MNEPTTLEELQFRFKCKKTWDDLQASPQEGIRYCNDCKKHVNKIMSLEQLKMLEDNQPCVAIETENKGHFLGAVETNYQTSGGLEWPSDD